MPAVYLFSKEQREIAQEELINYFRNMDRLWEAMLVRLEQRLGMDSEAVAQLVEEEK